ncbi:hypothetical protein BBJ28_00013578 [Nothophytophthora sp. Chile5]|nr:hypothetical protein BBJ28_00013578 [Nothophytophthora sp. Chile5]
MVHSTFRPRKSRRVFDFPIETLREYAHYRQDEAARALGVAPITLKRICHRRQYRWPYRTLKARARREARLNSQKLQTPEVYATRTHTLPPLQSPPASPQRLPSAQALLLMLRQRKDECLSPTNSGASSPASAMDVDDGAPLPSTTRRPLSAQFPLARDQLQRPIQLSPDFSLTRLLNQQKPLAPPASPPLASQAACLRPMHHHPLGPKTASRAASFKAEFPSASNGRFWELTDRQTTAQPQHLLPSADFLLSRFPHSQYSVSRKEER